MRRPDRIRSMIAREAARLMYEDGIKEYRDAKRKAAKVFGPEKSLCLGSHLPSNAEIHEELRSFIQMYEGEVQPERLLRMRILALSFLELFSCFQPYLVGSVLAGTVTERSDIDLHLFADSIEEIESFLQERDMPFESELVSIRHGGEIHDYTHLFLEEDGIVIECSVYARSERYRRSISSITGRPMERADAAHLRKLITADSKPFSD